MKHKIIIIITIIYLLLLKIGEISIKSQLLAIGIITGISIAYIIPDKFFNIILKLIKKD